MIPDSTVWARLELGTAAGCCGGRDWQSVHPIVGPRLLTSHPRGTSNLSSNRGVLIYHLFIYVYVSYKFNYIRLNLLKI